MTNKTLKGGEVGKPEKSEFGKGLMVCLGKFAEHIDRFRIELEHTREMAKQSPLFDDSHAVEMWYNASSDHLYELEIPKKLRRKKVGKLLKELQNRSLEIGHGYSGKKWSLKDFEWAVNTLHEIYVLLDAELGIKADLGEY